MIGVSSRVQCPRCGRWWTVTPDMTEVECVCHLYCDYGSDPKDCSTAPYDYSGSLGYPAGMHTDASDNGDDLLHRARYCSTHEQYIYKDAVQIPVDRSLFKVRLPEHQRRRNRL